MSRVGCQATWEDIAFGGDCVRCALRDSPIGMRGEISDRQRSFPIRQIRVISGVVFKAAVVDDCPFQRTPRGHEKTGQQAWESPREKSGGIFQLLCIKFIYAFPAVKRILFQDTKILSVSRTECLQDARKAMHPSLCFPEGIESFFMIRGIRP